MQRQFIRLPLSALLALTIIHSALGSAADSVCKTSYSSSSEVSGSGVCAGDVFLRGNYVEVGIHRAGSYGTTYGAPAGSNYAYQSSLGRCMRKSEESSA